MDYTNMIAFVVAIAGLVGAITALVMQTQKLITIAESYMLELRKSNQVQAVQATALTAAVSAVAPLIAATPAQPPS